MKGEDQVESWAIQSNICNNKSDLEKAIWALTNFLAAIETDQNYLFQLQ
jgi:hypothetical protein